MYASSGPFPETVRVLLDRGASVDLVDGDEGWTALMFAGGEGHVEVIEILLGYGADPMHKDLDGDTALAFAERNGHTRAAKVLQSAMGD